MAIDYSKLSEITVTNQAEMDAIPDDFRGRIYINCTATVAVNKQYYWRVVARENSSVEAWGNSSVVAWENSSVEARGNSSVVARENSSVVAWENSSVEARGNSSVVARENSSVVAWGNSSVVAWENSSVEARENSSVVARENSSVVARENPSVEAWENSSVEAWGNSSVVAWENSSVEARGNSSVVARENSSVEAWGNSSVEAWENSSVEAWGNSSVEAWENSSVVASGNSQIVNRQINGKIQISGNAREVFMPKNIHEFMDFYGITHTKKTATFYKAVRKDKNGYYSDHDSAFRYNVGTTAAEKCDPDPVHECSYGIHIAHLDWALRFGDNWYNLAILEVTTDIADIVMPNDTDGKVRTSKIKVIREVPLEECGVYGRILAKRRSN